MLTAKQYELALAMSSDRRVPPEYRHCLVDLASPVFPEPAKKMYLDRLARYVPDLVDQFKKAT